jgi:hypothetical protein
LHWLTLPAGSQERRTLLPDVQSHKNKVAIATLISGLQGIEELETWKNTERDAVVIEVTSGLR